MSNIDKKIGDNITVYCRHLFAVPVRGRIADVSEHDGAYKVFFDTDNPGGKNVTKHNGKYFLPEQCRFDESVKMSGSIKSEEGDTVAWVADNGKSIVFPSSYKWKHYKEERDFSERMTPTRK